MQEQEQNQLEQKQEQTQLEREQPLQEQFYLLQGQFQLLEGRSQPGTLGQFPSGSFSSCRDNHKGSFSCYWGSLSQGLGNSFSFSRGSRPCRAVLRTNGLQLEPV